MRSVIRRPLGRREPGGGRPRAGTVAMAILAVAPWTWYLWRDGFGAEPLAVAADQISLLLPALAAVAVVSVLLVGFRLGRPALAVTGAASWVVFGVLATAAPWGAHGGPAPVEGVRVVFANLGAFNESAGAVDDLLDHGADLVVTAETTGAAYTELVRRLGPPDAEGGDGGVCTLAGAGGCSSVNVWSPGPVAVAGDRDGVVRPRGIRAEARGPGGPFVLHAVHVRSPNPAGGEDRTTPWSHRTELEELLDAAGAEEVPVVVVGDLNLSDRQSMYRRFDGRLVDAMRADTAGPTSLRWFLRPLLLRIDHVFVSDGWCADGARRFTVEGSDHRGVVATIGPCPA